MRKRVFSILQTSALPLGYRALCRKAELAGKNGARKRRIIPVGEWVRALRAVREFIFKVLAKLEGKR
jgi:hypothetical protein